MASCGFAELVGGVCGCSRNHGPSNVECVITKERTVYLKIFLLDCEAKLTLARAGKKVHTL